MWLFYYTSQFIHFTSGEVILPCPDIAHEGALWFPDLTAADPTLIIPCAVGIFNLANIEVSNLSHIQYDDA